MHPSPHLSEAVFVGMCREIGTSTEVRIRREVADIQEKVWRPLWVKRGIDMMRSGSQSEGFRLLSSDVDQMFWLTANKVIDDLSQLGLYTIPQDTVIIMEGEDIPPGFTRLKMLTSSTDPKVNVSCSKINGETYIFSSLFRARFLEFNKYAVVSSLSSREHGPCVTVSFSGTDFDHVYCFRSYHWPKEALPWIQRCQLKHWPEDFVLSAIVNEGCHIVPIGSEPERDNEWRISFSRAEQRLVYSMNHCQFICYGLLKFFLKEVINTGNNDSCLCSYFMKTLVFWVIQNKCSLVWVPENLLMCFWTCFKLLISLVYKGECPNFFIPQNNMFRVKVVGHRQAILFDQLCALYNKGISCLLLSPTIGKYLREQTLNRNLITGTDETTLISNYRIDVCLFMEIQLFIEPNPINNEEFARVILAIEQLPISRSTLVKTITVHIILPKLLRRFCFRLRQNTAFLKNKNQFYLLNMMKLAVKNGCIPECLYLALYLYKNCQYERSLRCLRKAQGKLIQPYVVYYGYNNEELYKQAMTDVAFGNRIKECLIYDISLIDECTYIDELVSEQLANKAECHSVLRIPPLVMLHMLFVLNHRKLEDTLRVQQSLQDLHILLLYDDGKYIPWDLKDISWQILGICQQTCGDYVGALKSFQLSLQQISGTSIKKATIIRILSIYGHFLHKY